MQGIVDPKPKFSDSCHGRFRQHVAPFYSPLNEIVPDLINKIWQSSVASMYSKRRLQTFIKYNISSSILRRVTALSHPFFLPYYIHFCLMMITKGILFNTGHSFLVSRCSLIGIDCNYIFYSCFFYTFHFRHLLPLREQATFLIFILCLAGCLVTLMNTLQ